MVTLIMYSIIIYSIKATFILYSSQEFINWWVGAALENTVYVRYSKENYCVDVMNYGAV